MKIRFERHFSCSIQKVKVHGSNLIPPPHAQYSLKNQLIQISCRDRVQFLKRGCSSQISVYV